MKMPKQEPVFVPTPKALAYLRALEAIAKVPLPAPHERAKGGKV